MSLFDRGIRGNVQSPFASVSADTIAYGNARMPLANQGNIHEALDYLFEAMYPNYEGTVATPADLPASADPNAWYMVNDDGDGKAAGYVWTVTGAGGTWVKRYDVDWSMEQILAETVNRTQYMYAAKYGVTDKDASGNAITGTFAGQHIYGGDATTQNLTLTANFYDTTGYVQTTSSFRPTADNTLDLGTSALHFRTGYFSTSLKVGTTTLSPAALADSSGSFSFNALNVATTGHLTGGEFITGTMTISAGSILDTSGGITFGSANLSTSGTIMGAASSKLADITFTNGTLSTLTAGGFNFSNQNISGVGTLNASLVATSEVDVGNLVLSGQTLKTNSSATALILQAGTGGNTTTVQINSDIQANFDAVISGVVTVSGSGTSGFTGPITVGSKLSLSLVSTVATVGTSSGDLNLAPNSNNVNTPNVIASADATYTLGSATKRYTNVYLSGNIGDGTNLISMATLLSLRGINTGVGTGNILSWNGTQWVPESTSGVIDHTTLTNLVSGDSGHTQFALLAGRSGGQLLQGDTAASGNLTLDSTAHATKGLILAKSDIAPNTDASYSAGWSGTNLGGASRNFVDIYSKGVHHGLRLEAYAGSGSYPSSSGQNVGRLIFDSTTNQVVIDTGSIWVPAGQQKFVSDVSWNGSQTTQTITISGSITDARTAIWQMLDNTNNYEQIFCKITKSQTQVTITVSPALPAGSYRLIGLN